MILQAQGNRSHHLHRKISLFFQTNIKRIQTKLPSIEKIKHIALSIFQLSLFTLACFTMPIVTTIGTAAFFVIYTVVKRSFKQELKKEMRNEESYDLDHLKRIAKSIKTLKSFQNKFYICTIVQNVVFTILFPAQLLVNTIILVAGIGLWIFDNYQLNKTKRPFNQTFEEYRNKQEHDILKDEFPNLNNEELYLICQKEKQLRPQKKQYLHHQQEMVAKAWETLLKKKHFTINQGFERDYKIFEILCRFAVFHELKLKLALNYKKCPPSLSTKFQKLKITQIKYRKLNKKEKKELENKLTNWNSVCTKKVSEVAARISQFAYPMMQSQKLFQKPLQTGTSRYCLKHLKLKPFFKIQFERWLAFKNRLFFQASS